MISPALERVVSGARPSGARGSRRFLRGEILGLQPTIEVGGAKIPKRSEGFCGPQGFSVQMGASFFSVRAGRGF